ncbi:MAG: SMP-30/gluconolactonase/LRE family protein [Acidobacteriia bacterium]|nr:SMP-30/gluconolactonase/LRE family protein [Terriglobia bacterium]
MKSVAFASGLRFPEGPVAMPDGTWLVVEGGDRGCVTQITADGKERRTVAVTGLPNGLAVDSAGSIWVAEPKVPSLLRVTLDGKVEVFMTECHGEPFLYPNDLCFGPDGALYLTDSGITAAEFEPGGNVRPDFETCPMDGRVYRIGVKTKTIEKIDSGVRFTNGIAFGPDNDLYANETITGAVYRYRRQSDGFGPREPFGNVWNDSRYPTLRGPDGMAFGADGKLYVAVYGQGDVTVLGTDGKVAQRLRTLGGLPTNVAFGLAGQRKLYVTEYQLGQLEVFPVETDGLPLWT